MEIKVVTPETLSYFKTKQDAANSSKFSENTHKHSATDITSGTLPVSNGGTGAPDAATARSNLDITPENIGAAASSHGHEIADIDGLQDRIAERAPMMHTHPTTQITSGTLPIERGGTGAGNASSARSNLGITPANIGAAASSHSHTASNISDLKSWLLNNVFKVGYVWVSYTSTSPASIVGGTWSAITGRFPYFNAGTGTGGSNTHTLTVDQMPTHRHGMAIKGSWQEDKSAGLWSPGNVFSGRGVVNNSGSSSWGTPVEQTLMGDKRWKCVSQQHASLSDAICMA